MTALVKSYIDSNTCKPVTYPDYSDTICRDNAKSYYEEFMYNGKRVIVTNNVGNKHECFSDRLGDYWTLYFDLGLKTMT